MKDKLLVFQSDFGILEGTVSQMHGISMKVDPTLRIFDLTHCISKFNTWEASYSLYQTCHAWPAETVFVSVVDPGVGSGRKSVVAKSSAGHYIVTPDNGTLTHLKKHVGIEALREIDESVNRVKGSEKSHVFHGRDVYAFTGARLASGVIDFEGVGPEVSIEGIVSHEIIDPVQDGKKITGILDIEDPHFGMVWTNIPLEFFESLNISFGDEVRTVIEHEGEVKFSEVLPYCRTFTDVPKDHELVYNNEIGNLAVATNFGSFVEKFGIQAGTDWKISFELSAQNRLKYLPVLEDELFIMRPVELSDAGDMFEYGSDEEVVKFLPWGPYKSIEEVRSGIEAFFLTRPEQGLPCAYAIVWKESNRVIGTCDFHSVNSEENSGGIGFVLHRSYWGRGIITRASRLLIDVGFSHLGYDRITLAHTPENKAVERVAEKLGFTYLGDQEHRYHEAYEKKIMKHYELRK